MRNLSLSLFLRCNTIDNNLQVVVQLTLGTFSPDSSLFGLGPFLGWRIENFFSRAADFGYVSDSLTLGTFIFMRSPDGWLDDWVKVRDRGSVAFRFDTGVVLLDWFFRRLVTRFTSRNHCPLSAASRWARFRFLGSLAITICSISYRKLSKCVLSVSHSSISIATRRAVFVLNRVI